MRRRKSTRTDLLPKFRGALYNSDPGSAGGGGTAGTGTPGTPTPGTGTGDQPEYLSKKEFGQTAALISGLKKNLETLSGSALTSEKLNEALAGAGILVKQEDGTFKPAFQAPTAKPEDKGTPPPNPLEGRVKNLEKQLADAQKAVEDERTKTADEKLNRAAVEALRKAGAVNPERDYVHLKAMITADGDAYFVKTKDTSGVEQQFALEDYAGTWLEGNPELRKAQGAAGSGTKPGTGGSGVQTASLEQARDPEWYLANRDKIAKGEIRLARPA